MVDRDIQADSPLGHRVTRRSAMQLITSLLAPLAYASQTQAGKQGQSSTVVNATDIAPYDSTILPTGVRSRFVNNGNGLTMHVLEAGFAGDGRPLVILLHGFPELAYSWRKALPALAAAGFHVVAPDMRGFGRTSGGGLKYEDDASDFLFLNGVRDILGLIFASGYKSVAAGVGHDRGSEVAAWCALVRPDVFRSLVLLSPFAGPPAPTGRSLLASGDDPIYEQLTIGLFT